MPQKAKATIQAFAIGSAGKEIGGVAKAKDTNGDLGLLCSKDGA